MKRFAAFIISAAVMLSGYAGKVQVFAAAESETNDYVYAPLQSVQNIHGMFCTISGGSLSLKTTPVQAHRGFRLLTLASSILTS